MIDVIDVVDDGNIRWTADISDLAAVHCKSDKLTTDTDKWGKIAGLNSLHSSTGDTLRRKNSVSLKIKN